MSAVRGACISIGTIAVVTIIDKAFGDPAAMWMAIGALVTTVFVFWEAGGNASSATGADESGAGVEERA